MEKQTITCPWCEKDFIDYIDNWVCPNCGEHGDEEDLGLIQDCT
jgi:rubrerythrin